MNCVLQHLVETWKEIVVEIRSDYLKLQFHNGYGTILTSADRNKQPLTSGASCGCSMPKQKHPAPMCHPQVIKDMVATPVSDFGVKCSRRNVGSGKTIRELGIRIQMARWKSWDWGSQTLQIWRYKTFSDICRDLGCGFKLGYIN